MRRCTITLTAGAVLLAIAISTDSALARVYVPETLGDRGPFYRYKPRTLQLPSSADFYPDTTIVATRLSWKNWGKAVATASTRIRTCDPDNGGCQTDKGRISLSRVMSNGCGDESPRKMYNRATVAGSAVLGTRPVVFEPLLNC